MKILQSLILTFIALLCCGAAHADVKTSNIFSLDDLNVVISEMGKNAESVRYLQLEGKKTNAKKYGDEITKSMWMDYAHHWHTRYWENSPRLELTLELKEGTRLLAAMLDEKRVSRLRSPERVALKQMQKIADKCNMSGTTRVEKVMMVLDDLRHNSRLTDKRGDKKRKGAFTSFVIRKQGDTGTCAEYLQVMLTALDIPCHTYDAYWMSRNMVQLDNGKWYLIKDNMSGLEVVAMPENDVNMPEFPALADVCDVAIPAYASAAKFWAAAEKAFAEGSKCMGARVKKYPGARMFKEAYEQHLAEGGNVVPAEMYLPSDEGKSRYVCVSFAQPEEVVSPEENPFEIKPEVNEPRKKFRKLYED